MKIRVRNNSISIYHCRVDPKLEKVFVKFIVLPVRIQFIHINLINIGCQILVCLLNQDMLLLETVKLIDH